MINLKTYESFSSDHNQKELFSIITNKIFHSKKDPTKTESDALDRISDYPNLYNTTKSWVKSNFDIFKKYNYNDIDDRLLEFFDTIKDTGKKLRPIIKYVIFFGSDYNSQIYIDHKKLNEEEYLIEMTFRTLERIKYHCVGYKQSGTVDEYFKSYKQSLLIKFNDIRDEDLNDDGFYEADGLSIKFLNDLSEKILKRFNYLYGIEKSKKCDIQSLSDDNVYEYSLILFLK